MTVKRQRPRVAAPGRVLGALRQAHRQRVHRHGVPRKLTVAKQQQDIPRRLGVGVPLQADVDERPLVDLADGVADLSRSQPVCRRAKDILRQ